MLMGLDLLASDDATEVIVLTSKPPDEQVSRRVLARAAACPKPVVVNFLGGDPALVVGANLTPANTLEEAAQVATHLILDSSRKTAEPKRVPIELEQSVKQEARKLRARQRYIRGLYSGGTLCYEAMLVLGTSIPDLYSNIPLRAEMRLQDPWQSHQHTLVDLGDDAFTQGRAHPMIDPTLRVQRLLQEASDAEVAVLLFDVVLGYGSHANPAEPMAEALALARAKAEEDGRNLIAVAYVCGTEEDPQQRSVQEKMLREAGVLVAASNAQASRIAAQILGVAKR
jgi:succinyl-CoA synthetase alpha subunit